MTYRPTPFGIEVVAHYERDGNPAQRAANVWHFHSAGPDPTPVLHGDLQNCLDDVVSSLNGRLMPLLSDFAKLTRVTARDISQESGELIEATPNTVGGSGIEPLPLAVATVITWRTAKPGRSFRGRTYVPFVPRDRQDTSDPNKSTTAWQTAMLGFASGFKSDVAGRSHILSIKSGVHNHVTLDPQVLTAVTGQAVDLRLDIQRRRGRSV